VPKPPGAVRLSTRITGLAEPLRRCAEHHRHLPRVAGGLVGVEVIRADTRWPVAWGIIGRPVSRHLDGSGWAELTRSIVPDGAPPGCASAILGAAARWAREQGRPLVTYTLAHEPGTSLRAAGWVELAVDARTPRQWGCPSRPRAIRPAIVAAPKRRWVPPWAVPQALARGWRLAVAPPAVGVACA
jgi:hypothetical protein